MWYLALQRWTGDAEEAIRTRLDAHYAWQLEQQRAGRVLISGPTPDHQVGITVFGDMSEAALHELLESEPFIAGGYRTYEVFPWDVHHLLGIGGFSRDAVVAMDAGATGAARADSVAG